MIRIDFEEKHIELSPTKIIAVARNYRAHAQELGHSVPEEVKFFLKPPSAMIPHNGLVRLPRVSKHVDFEVELAVIMKNQCSKVSPPEVAQSILGYSIIVDITARDIQQQAMKAGMPWTIAKGFDTFAPIGPRIVSADKISPKNLEIWLKLNGEYKQRSNTQSMIFPVDELISYISQIMTLEPLDIIATGTPEGVGPMQHGDFVEAGIENIGVLEFQIQKEK